MTRIIDWKVLKTIVPYSRQHIKRLEDEGKFPLRVILGDNTPFFHIDYLGQLPENLEKKLLATAQIMTTRTGVVDGKVLEPHFHLNPQDIKLTDLQPDQAYVRTDETHRIYTHPHDLPKVPRKFKLLTPPIEKIDKDIETFMNGL